MVLRHQNRNFSIDESISDEGPDNGTHLKLRFVAIDADEIDDLVFEATSHYRLYANVLILKTKPNN